MPSLDNSIGGEERYVCISSIHTNTTKQYFSLSSHNRNLVIYAAFPNHTVGLVGPSESKE